MMLLFQCHECWISCVSVVYRLHYVMMTSSSIHIAYVMMTSSSIHIAYVMMTSSSMQTHYIAFYYILYIPLLTCDSNALICSGIIEGTALHNDSLPVEVAIFSQFGVIYF